MGVRSRSMGASSLIDLAIQVEPRLTASCAHRLAEEVRLKVMERCEDEFDTHVSEVLVHVDVDKHDAGCPLQSSVLKRTRPYSEVVRQTKEVLLRLEQVTEVPHVQVHYMPSGIEVDIQVRMQDQLSVSELRETAVLAREQLLAVAADVRKVSIGLTSTCLPSCQQKQWQFRRGEPRHRQWQFRRGEPRQKQWPFRRGEPRQKQWPFRRGEPLQKQWPFRRGEPRQKQWPFRRVAHVWD